ncbi:MAG: hypothetical protein JSS32_09460 [Verrucomicrobia bacterium]|nr:hypothetical protein [Verrucomicrobiota bacterium]
MNQVDKYSSRELFKSLSELYGREERGLLDYDTRLKKFHASLNERNAKLETESYPTEEILSKEVEDYAPIIGEFQTSLPRIYDLFKAFKEGIEKLKLCQVEPNHLGKFSFYSSRLGDKTRRLHQEHLESVAQIQILHDRIYKIYSESQDALNKISTHTMLKFHQRIENVRKGIKEPSVVRSGTDWIARYTPPSISNQISNMPASMPPYLSLRGASPRVDLSSSPPSNSSNSAPPPEDNIQGSDNYPSEELFKSLMGSYSPQERTILDFDANLKRFHKELNDRNLELESLEKYPTAQELLEEIERHSKRIAEFQAILPVIYELLAPFEKGAATMDQNTSDPAQVSKLSFYSSILGENVQGLADKHQENAATIRGTYERILEIYKYGEATLRTIREHTMVQFHQRHENVKQGATKPSKVQAIVDRGARYLPTSIASWFSNVPRTLPVYSTSGSSSARSGSSAPASSSAAGTGSLAPSSYSSASTGASASTDLLCAASSSETSSPGIGSLAPSSYSSASTGASASTDLLCPASNSMDSSSPFAATPISISLNSGSFSELADSSPSLLRASPSPSPLSSPVAESSSASLRTSSVAASTDSASTSLSILRESHTSASAQSSAAPSNSKSKKKDKSHGGNTSGPNSSKEKKDEKKIQ